MNLQDLWYLNRFNYKQWSHFNFSFHQNILMTLIMKTHTQISPCRKIHAHVLHTRRVLLCHLGMSSFYNALDPIHKLQKQIWLPTFNCRSQIQYWSILDILYFLHVTKSTKTECNRKCQLTLVLLLGLVEGWTHHTSCAMHTFCNLFILRCVIFCHCLYLHVCQQTELVLFLQYSCLKSNL
jgi:hypothetical protein